jgi:hypothetical protein
MKESSTMILNISQRNTIEACSNIVIAFLCVYIDEGMSAMAANELFPGTCQATSLPSLVNASSKFF